MKISDDEGRMKRKEGYGKRGIIKKKEGKRRCKERWEGRREKKRGRE